MKKNKTVLIQLISILFFSKLAICQITEFESKASFRAVQMVDKNIIYASGSNGTIIKSTDSGKTWTNVCPKIYQNFDFRGIAVLNKNTLIAISAGKAEDGKAFVIKSEDGGLTWVKTYQNTEKGVFFDTIKFESSKIGYILSDPVDGKLYVLKTVNAGKSWLKMDKNLMPNVFPNEASFAASNSCISIYDKTIWINTQNRIFRSKNSGKSWTIITTPFESGESKGIFGMYFKNELEGIAVGGDYVDKTNKTIQLAMTKNGGGTWAYKPINFKIGLTESAAMTSTNKIIAASLHGIAVTNDEGINWNILDSTPFHAVTCNKTVCFSVGGDGKIGRWEF